MYRLKIRQIAEERGLSRSRLSRISDVDIKVIRRAFKNEQESITLPVLDRIARALKIDISDLIESLPETEEK